jgi:hypothetical protein
LSCPTPRLKPFSHLGGGSFVSFRLKDQNLNPLRWLGPADQNVVNRPMAHFLCLDRWGAPSEAEIASGMFFHGEAARVAWKADGKGGTSSKMSAVTADGESSRSNAKRGLDSRAALLERSRNGHQSQRAGQVVQHGAACDHRAAFLDETTVVDSNAGRGFMQSSPLPNPEEPSVQWPNAAKDGRSVDLRHLRDDPMPNVVSYVIDQPLGWVTASTAKQGLLIGYLWKTSEYPWFNAWRHVDDKHPALWRAGWSSGQPGLHQTLSRSAEEGVDLRTTHLFLSGRQRKRHPVLAQRFCCRFPTTGRAWSEFRSKGGQDSW